MPKRVLYECRSIGPITILGKITPKGRPRAFADRAGNIRAYTPQKTVYWENYVKLSAQDAMFDSKLEKPLEGPIGINVFFHFNKGQGIPKFKEYRDKKPDIDNVLKSLMDALEGVIYARDSEVVFVRMLKKYDNADKTVVEIFELPEGEDGMNVFDFFERGT